MALKLVLIRKSTPFKIGGLTVVLQSVQKPVGHISFILRKIVLSTITMLFTQTLVAQLNLTYDLKKPKAYENRKLKSEMTPDKKINPVKRMKEKASKSLKETFSRITPSFTGKKHTEETKIKIGLVTSKAQKGEGNSQFGTCWITNGTDNKKHKKGEVLPEGWWLGRIITYN